jgi:hypothetical protein
MLFFGSTPTGHETDGGGVFLAAGGDGFACDNATMVAINALANVCGSSSEVEVKCGPELVLAAGSTAECRAIATSL